MKLDRNLCGGALVLAAVAGIISMGEAAAAKALPTGSVRKQAPVPSAQADCPSSIERSPAAPPASRPALQFGQNGVGSGWVPFEFFGGSRIFIPVTVNGHAASAMLDSGASETVLDATFARRTGMVPEGQLRGEGDGGSTSYGVVDDIALKIGDLGWSGHKVVAIDLAGVSRQMGREIAVVLGGAVFRESVVDIDFERRRIAFRDPARLTVPVGAVAVGLTPAGDNRALTATVEGRPARLLFDLGNAGAVDLFPRFWNNASFARRKTSTTLAGGVGGMSVRKIALLKRVVIGGSAFKAVPSRLEDAQSSQDARCGQLDGNIGMGIFARFHLMVDFPGNRIILGPPVDQVTPFRVNHSGLTLRPGAEGASVLYVAPGSPAALSGIVAGDVVVSVDGGSSAAAAAGEWQFGAPGTAVHLMLKDGKRKTVRLARYF